MSNLTAVPVAVLTFLGLLFAVLGLFNAALGVAALGLGAVLAAGVLGVLDGRVAGLGRNR